MGIKKTISFTVLVGILTCFFTNQSYSQENNGEHDDAIQYAERFLLLIDNNKYQETWGWLSDIFKKTIVEDQWVADLKGFRKPLGKLLKRKLLYVTKSSDVDIGNYVIVQYQSSFEAKKTKGEAVSVMKDRKGELKVLGYTIF